MLHSGLNYKVKIGLVPIRRDVTPRPGIFNWEKAEERGVACVKYIIDNFTTENVSFVDLKGVNDVEVMYCENDVDKALEKFKAEKVDAVVIINSNFGNEEAAGRFAKEMDRPVLLWGPIDDVFEPDGTRYTDTQCGLFGTSRQFQRLGVKFSYIENCKITDEVFADGLKKFIAVACMVKNFRGMRIAQVGCRPKPFCSVMINEHELLAKFGVQVVPVNMATVIDKFNRVMKENVDEIKKGADLIRARYEIDEIVEKDGEKLIMYRPALSGSIIAKIESLTKPAMATVRTKDSLNKDVFVAVGYGAKDSLEWVKDLANKYDAELSSTRKAVDNGIMPYATQVGLTGRSVAPPVYIAVGVSGAVHHIVGMQSSGTVIAINSDKNADIFNYADYGIIEDIGYRI